MLKVRRDQWTPLHSPLVRRRSVPDRIADALRRVEGPLSRPTPPVISCVTGRASYRPGNIGELLTQWSDHPQRLWDVVISILTSGVRTIVHAGPAPRLIPKTFESISSRSARQRDRPISRTLAPLLGSTLGRWPRLGRLVPEKVRVLRAPHLTHVLLEDWLLDQAGSG